MTARIRRAAVSMPRGRATCSCLHATRIRGCACFEAAALRGLNCNECPHKLAKVRARFALEHFDFWL